MRHNDRHTAKAIPTGTGEAERMQAMDESSPPPTEPAGKGVIIHVKMFVVRCQHCTTPEEQVIMQRVMLSGMHYCGRCGLFHDITQDERTLAAEHGQPTGTDKRPMVYS
jgi:hypothetical protein